MQLPNTFSRHTRVKSWFSLPVPLRSLALADTLWTDLFTPSSLYSPPKVDDRDKPVRILVLKPEILLALLL